MLARVNQAEKNNTELNANLAKQFAWLLREDLRKTFKTADDPAFADWWLIKGRQEYPAWAHEISEAELQSLFTTVGKATIAGVLVEVPQVVQLMARYRGDAVREYTAEGKLDNEKFLAWALVVGLAEHHLAVYAPRAVVAMLDQPVPSTEAQEGETHKTPTATLLMYLLWRLMDETTQQARNIFTAQGREAYLAWFFSVVEQLNIEPLVAGRWRSWVKAQVSYRAAQLAWGNVGTSPPQRQQHTYLESKPFGVNLYGFAYGELGIGEDLRMAVACCEMANIPYHVVNVDAGKTSQGDLYLKGKIGDINQLPPYRINVFCLPAFDTVSRVFMRKGVNIFQGYTNIGWWQWELAIFPKSWKPYVFKLVDEIWASSRFLMEMYRQATDKPVKLVPLAVDVSRIRPYTRKYFGLNKNKFVFLYIFDFNSTVSRKNPMATVRAFKQAFKIDDKSVNLVIKTMNSKPDSIEWQEFDNSCKKDKRIKIITETLDRSEVLALINSCDAYISLHRAEGFGRTIAEAILLGKPVIATNYSGNTDYMSEMTDSLVSYTEVLIKENEYHWITETDFAKWADPDVFDASEKMKKIRANKRIDFQYENYVFSTEHVGEMIVKALQSIYD